MTLKPHRLNDDTIVAQPIIISSTSFEVMKQKFCLDLSMLKLKINFVSLKCN